LSIDVLEELKPTLQLLTPYFAPGARVELVGCNVAEGDDGARLLRGLAQIWGVKVQASEARLPIGTVQFSGVVDEAAPDGGPIKSMPATEVPNLNARQPEPPRPNAAPCRRPMPPIKLKEFKG
jgi:hypothetical protein